MKKLIEYIIEGNNLSEKQAEEAMEMITTGMGTPTQTASLITAIRMKGETIDEITGFAKVMRKKAEKINLNSKYSIDTCGTGGDSSNTFNISTATAFVVSAGGVIVSKHGNRSVSSRCGSADVLESLGIKIDMSPEQVEKCMNEIGIGFMFAPIFHKSMKYVAKVRKEIGTRTIFNVLGPLTNPANAKGQLLGVFSEELVSIMAEVLKRLKVEKAMVVHGDDGFDEITLNGNTKVCELSDGIIKKYEINPIDYGLELCKANELEGGDSETNAKIILDIFKGKERGAKRDVVVINSAAALYIGNKVNTLYDGINIAKGIIDTGKAMEKVNELVAFSNSLKG